MLRLFTKIAQTRILKRIESKLDDCIQLCETTSCQLVSDDGDSNDIDSVIEQLNKLKLEVSDEKLRIKR